MDLGPQIVFHPGMSSGRANNSAHFSIKVILLTVRRVEDGASSGSDDSLPIYRSKKNRNRLLDDDDDGDCRTVYRDLFGPSPEICHILGSL
jgi:hypothetical protein